MKNQTLKDTISALEKASEESGKAIWKALAEDLDTAKRRRVAVNLSRIERHVSEDEVAAIPGKVLAAGRLTKPIKIAAFSFSEGALEKIKAAKAEAMTLDELLEAGIQPSQIRIIK
ncbi:MAG: 50S ribosomal protein L18e [Candidatus Bathyarchaeota archaeon]|nr:50S ribosomal protein L18e [Candidatus Bathyarchaeota archaeon]